MQALKEWFSGKVFTFVHGRNLVYNTCWEDPRLDKAVLDLGPEDELLVITSAGCNALSYALTGLKHVYAVDMNYRQNALLELKIAGIRELDYNTFFTIFGEGRYPGIKKLYREKLRAHLSADSKRFWDKKIVKYFDSKRKSFYFSGTTGAFAKGMNFFINRIARLRKPLTEMMECDDLSKQSAIWYTEVREKFWSRLVKFVVNRDATLSLLGVPRAQRLQIEKTYPGGLIKFVQNCLDAVCGQLPLKDNYFWRVYTTGSYTKDCCPEYLEEANFNALKNGLVDRISVHTNTVRGFLENHQGTISRFVLLDHMDWLSERLYNELVLEWKTILEKRAPKTTIIWRSGGLRTDYIDTVPVTWKGEKTELGKILKMNPGLAAELHEKDRVHTYGSFYIAKLED